MEREIEKKDRGEPKCPNVYTYIMCKCVRPRMTERDRGPFIQKLHKQTPVYNILVCLSVLFSFFP